MVLSAVLLAVNMAVTKNWMARWGPLRVIGGGYLFAALFALPLALLDWRAAAPTSPSAVQWSALGYTIFIAGGLGTVIWYRTVRYVGASRAAVYQFLQPVFGATSAALFVGETLTVWQIAGFAITLVGVYLARPPTTPAPTTTSPEASPTVTRRFRQ